MELNGLNNQAAKGQVSSVLSIIHRSRVRPVAVVPSEVTLQPCFKDRPASNERSNLGIPHKT